MTTKLDVAINQNTWTNIHLASGLVAGTAITVQAKSANGAILFVGATAPSGRDGMIISATDLGTYNIPLVATEYVFARSVQFSGVIGVQV